MGGSDSRLTGGGVGDGDARVHEGPEQASGLTDRCAGRRCIPLGATAYFLLTGRPPFERPTLMLTLTAHITDPPPPLGDTIPADLAAIVLRCLAKKPEGRFADVCELAAALAACPCAADWGEPHAATWWTAHRPAHG